MDINNVRRIFSSSRKLSRHLDDVKTFEKSGGKTLATYLYGPVFPQKRKSGRPMSEAIEVGLKLLAQYKGREEILEHRQEILEKICPLYPGYDDVLQDQQAKIQDKLWKTLLATKRRRAAKGPSTK